MNSKGWVAKYEVKRACCYGSTLGSNSDIPKKIINCDICKGVRWGKYTVASQKIEDKKNF